MARDEVPLEELMDFPASFTFRIVARTSDGLAGRMVALVEEALGRAIAEVTERPSRQGNWRSVRVTAQVLTADEIRAVYAVLADDDGVIMTL